jgi:hypothetical protein
MKMLIPARFEISPGRVFVAIVVSSSLSRIALRVRQTGVFASSLIARPAAAAFFLKTSRFAFCRSWNARKCSFDFFCCASIFAWS